MIIDERGKIVSRQLVGYLHSVEFLLLAAELVSIPSDRLAISDHARYRRCTCDNIRHGGGK